MHPIPQPGGSVGAAATTRALRTLASRVLLRMLFGPSRRSYRARPTSLPPVIVQYSSAQEPAAGCWRRQNPPLQFRTSSPWAEDIGRPSVAASQFGEGLEGKTTPSYIPRPITFATTTNRALQPSLQITRRPWTLNLHRRHSHHQPSPPPAPDIQGPPYIHVLCDILFSCVVAKRCRCRCRRPPLTTALSTIERKRDVE